MPNVRLRGLKQVTRRLADGTRATYWYAWTGGPRLEGKPGSPEFIASYNRAVADRRSTPADTLAGLVATYRASPEYIALAKSTKRQWARWLGKIEEREGPCSLGAYTLAALDDRRVKADILDWRDQWATSPRSADYAMQVLSRVLAYGVARGELAMNAAAGIGKLYASDRADQIWTESEIARYELTAATPEAGFIVPLACLTGLRREDLTRLRWDHVGDMAIVLATGKSGGRRTATIPILPELRDLLRSIRAQAQGRRSSGFVLETSHGKAWSTSGLSHAVLASGIGKRLHDTRGTYATRLRMAGLKASQIADIMGWEEARVERILAVYVDREAVILDIARTLAGRNKSAT